MKTLWLLSVLALILGFSTTGAGAESVPGMKGLKCIAIRFTLSNSSDRNAAKECGITEQEMKELLLVGVRAKIPRLPVRDSCEPRLELEVTFLPPIAGFQAVYSIALDLRRRARISETQQESYVIVWRSGGVAHSPTSDCRENFTSFAEGSIQSFAAAYYEAGNP
jgi:hypothetical protein